MSKLEKISAVRARCLKTLLALITDAVTFSNQTDAAVIFVYRDEIDKAWNAYSEAFEECENLLIGKTGDEYKNLLAEFEVTFPKYIKNKSKMNSLIIPDPNTTINSSMQESSVKSVKIPAIEINAFSGNLSEWTEFKATCRAVITNDLPEIQKLQLLKRSLIGEPKELVAHILPSEGAYTQAFCLLQNRYENTRSIVNSLFKTFFDLPKNETESKDQLRIMLNTTNSLLSSLSTLNIVTESWDPMIVFFLTQKMNSLTFQHWEESLKGSKTIPDLKTFLSFLETRIIILEASVQASNYDNRNTYNKSNKFAASNNNNNQYQKQNRFTQSSKAFFTLNPNYKCYVCQQNHIASRCPTLMPLSYADKIKLINERNLCNNCLLRHNTQDCNAPITCSTCNGRHRTILHPDVITMTTIAQKESNNDENTFEMLEEDEQIEHQLIEYVNHSYTGCSVILATALVNIQVRDKTITLKALIDQGSTANLITTRATQLLRLNTYDTDVTLLGVGNIKASHITKYSQFTISSVYDPTLLMPIEALLVKNITNLKPLMLSTNHEWQHFTKLQLADPTYDKSSKIDLLLGASIYAEILQDGVVKGFAHEPIAQQTKLGWIVSGAISKSINQQALCNVVQSEVSIHRLLEQFWKIEEVSNSKILTPEEQAAEEVFVKSIKRCKNGRFMVDLPFKMNPYDNNCFGSSTQAAIKRYKSSLKRFSKNESLGEQYDICLNEYLELGQMELVDKKVDRFLVLPHHPVIKESSTTTKVRPVFDGSMKTSNGYSLNDRLMVGPTIQPELFTLIMQWRKGKYAISGDIEKMYRMILVNPDHANFQCIYWKKPGTDEIKLYRLLTVTFGTSSAPFQAIRALHEIGNDIKTTSPDLSKLIQQHFYVDDFMACFETVKEAKDTQKRMTQKLAEYGFTLRKWKSNCNEVLNDIAYDDKEKVLEIETTFKTLGISWQPSTDLFVFKSGDKLDVSQWTKRKILSEISKLFDPLGWLAPCIILSKLLMQDLWKLEIDWDEPVPELLNMKWLKLYEQLCSPISIQIPRWIGLSNNVQAVEVHGFSDASMLAYGAVVYLKIKQKDNTILCYLLSAKTKVAPIGRNQITLARLELCGALLLARLLDKTTQALKLEKYTQFAWSDSMITLSWIASHPSKWNVFVSNRVSEIQRTVPSNQWNYIPTELNPADLTSRGSNLQELTTIKHWWHGPDFLSRDEVFPKTINMISEEQLPEKRKCAKVHQITVNENDTLQCFSDYDRLLRFSAYVYRWLNRIKSRKSNIQTTNNNQRLQQKTLIPPVDAIELFAAKIQWIKIVQCDVFSAEIKCCKKGSHLPKNSLLNPLNPIIDNDGIIRMNGRVQNKEAAIILPGKHLFTELLIKYVHSMNVHCNVQTTLQFLRNEFWIVHARVIVKKIVQKCVICFRYNKCLLKQQMSKLPTFRTEQARPFAFVGCDYAGYFEIKMSERKNATNTKGYIALFICLTTKALHLEVVCDLSTKEFLIAFENFISRRGVPNTFYSDNGTNFIGGEKEIQQLHEQWFNQTNELTKLFASKQIKFRHTPAKASHMAGIWERAVGSVKYHLKRVLGDTKLTFRYFDHVLKQIEACLNSRPLWALTSESDDVEVLTPSHFFNFQALNTLPKPDVTHIQFNRLDLYQRLYKLYTDFWKVWSKEYVHQLQPRSKWFSKKENVKPGQIVIISDDNTPPSRWLLGRITNVYPDSEGLIRIVDVKCKNTVIKRPIHRLGLLPIIDNDSIDCPEDQSTGGEC